jgi:hypothetical protein
MSATGLLRERTCLASRCDTRKKSDLSTIPDASPDVSPSSQATRLSISEPTSSYSLINLLRAQLRDRVLIASSLRNLPPTARTLALSQIEETETAIDRLRLQVFGLAVANIDSDMRQHIRLLEAAHVE